MYKCGIFGKPCSSLNCRLDRQGYPLSCTPLSKLFNRCKAQISPSRLSFERTLDSRQNKER